MYITIQGNTLSCAWFQIIEVHTALHMNIMNVIFKPEHLHVPDFLHLNSSGKLTLNQCCIWNRRVL